MILFILLAWLVPPLVWGAELHPPVMKPSPVIASPNWQNNGPITPTAVLEGTVLTVDPTFEHMTLRDDQGQEHDFGIDSRTPVMGTYGPSRFQDLHPGDRIAITYQLQPAQVKNVQKH